MCSPAGLTGATAGLQIAGGVAGYNASRQQFKDNKSYLKQVYAYQSEQLAAAVQYRDDLANYQNELYSKNAEAVNKDVSGQYAAIGERLRQEDEAAQLEAQNLSRAARATSSLAIASAAERGVDGASVDAIMADIERAESEATFTISRQLQFNRNQAGRVLKGIEAQGQSRINQYLPQPLAPINMPAPLQGIRGPDLLSAILGTSAGLTNTLGNYYIGGRQ